MLHFGKQKAFVRKALIQMSLCTSPSPKATATCSMPKNMEKLVRGHWRQRPSFSVSWFPGRAAALIHFLRALGTYTLSCAVFHSEHYHTLLWRKQPLKKKALLGSPRQTSAQSRSRLCLWKRWACGWQLNFKSVTADCPKVLLSTTSAMVVVRLLSRVLLFVTVWTAARQASLSFTISQSLLNSCPWVDDAIQPSHPLPPPLLFLPSIFPTIRVFSNESALHIRWPKYWRFSVSISPSNEYSELISFGMTGLISLQSKGLSRVFSSTTVQKHQFFSTQPWL